MRPNLFHLWSKVELSNITFLHYPGSKLLERKSMWWKPTLSAVTCFCMGNDIQGFTICSFETRCLLSYAQIKVSLHITTAITLPANRMERHDDRTGGFKQQHFSIEVVQSPQICRLKHHNQLWRAAIHKAFQFIAENMKEGWMMAECHFKLILVWKSSHIN